MLGIFGIVVIFVATYQVYKAANGTGRSGILWALATFLIGFGIQIGIPMTIGMVLAVVWMAKGGSEKELRESLSGPAVVIGVVCLFLSFIFVWLMLRRVAKLPERKDFGPPPGPPAEF